MKKLLVLLLTMALLMTMGVTSYALTYSNNNFVVNDFTSFTTNTPIGTGDSNTEANATILREVGTASNFERVTGKFGKDAEDVSMKVSRITSSTATSRFFTRFKWLAAGNVGAGEYISAQWNWAFDDFNTNRTVNAQFYYTDKYTYSQANSFSNTGTTLNEHILNINPNGTITFFGTDVNTPYYFDLGKWYNFSIVVKVGTSTAEAQESGTTAQKSVAYLYVDGAQIATKAINAYSDTGSTIYRPYGLYSFSFVSNAELYSGSSETVADNMYIDDFYGGVYKDNATSPYFSSFGSFGDISLSGEGILTDGLHLSPADPAMTVARFTAALVKGADIKDITYVDSSKTAVTDTSRTVQDGDMIKIRTKRETVIGGVYSFETHYRKITDSICLFSNAFEDKERKTTSPSIGILQGYDYGTNSYAYAYNTGLKNNNACFSIKTYGSANLTAAQDGKIKYTIANPIPVKHVAELSLMRSQESEGYGELDFVASNFKTSDPFILGITNNEVKVRQDSGEWMNVLTEKTTKDRWYKVALEIDPVAKTARIYLNGVDTGVTRTFNSGANILQNFGIYISSPQVGLYGTSYLDDVKVYTGSYKSENITVEPTGTAIVTNANKELVFSDNVTAEDVNTSTGTSEIYSDTSYASSLNGNDSVPSGAVAVFRNPSTNIIEYYDLLGTPVISDISWAQNGGTLSASASVTNRCTQYKINDGMLIIAKYEDNELQAANIYTIDENNMVVGENSFSASIPYTNGDTIRAFLWKKDLTPLKTTAYIAQ